MFKPNAVVKFRRVARALLLLTVALAMSAAAVQHPSDATGSPGRTSAYPWPLRPFDQAHPVRAFLGDPRTVFRGALDGNPLAGPGTFSFHYGVDIDAPDGAPVYPVVSGVVRWVKRGYSVDVRAVDGRSFEYTHIATLVRPGQTVTARVTVLGRVKIWNEHLHFSEFNANGQVVNPLLPGHLSPFKDTTRPVVSALEVRSDGKSIVPFELQGRVALVVDSYDLPMAVGREHFPVTSFARDRFGVTPASLTWSMSTLEGRVVVPKTTVVDFRRELPGRAMFWNVYARGTYQNRAAISPRYHKQMPGRYLFQLTPGLDTTRLDDGVYLVTATAVDVRGNRGSLKARIEIRNDDSVL